jgi:NADH-quinone oxidoreductase subunit N
MNFGAFAVVTALGAAGEASADLGYWRGLFYRRPYLATVMTIFMLSLGGLPMTGGFIGKWFLFGGLLQRGAADGRRWYYWLALWAILNTVVSFYYYVRFIRAMYVSERVADERPLALSPALQASLVVCAVLVILIGVYPLPFIKAAETVVSALSGAGAIALR